MKISQKEKEILLLKANENRQKGLCLTKVFEDFANKTNRKSGSVRNFYYKTIKEMGISCKKKELFTKCQTVKLLTDILRNCAYGKSVRQVCLFLAKGDIVTALRYQNKYRSLLKKDRVLVQTVMDYFDKKGEKYFNPYNSKKDFLLLKLIREIDGLFERVGEREKRINEKLKQQIALLKQSKKAKNNNV